MRIFRRLRPLIVCVFLLASVYANLASETVTITVVQNEAAPAVAIDMSRTIEDEIFGRFFDAGHIASNTDVRFDGSHFSEKNFGVKEAAFGYSDYLIAVSLGYGPAEKKDESKNLTWAELVSLEWRVVRVQNQVVIAEKKVDVAQLKIADFDPYKQSRIVADSVTDQILAAIAKAKQGEKK